MPSQQYCAKLFTLLAIAAVVLMIAGSILAYHGTQNTDMVDLMRPVSGLAFGSGLVLGLTNLYFSSRQLKKFCMEEQIKAVEKQKLIEKEKGKSENDPCMVKLNEKLEKFKSMKKTREYQNIKSDSVDAAHVEELYNRHWNRTLFALGCLSLMFLLYSTASTDTGAKWAALLSGGIFGGAFGCIATYEMWESKHIILEGYGFFDSRASDPKNIGENKLRKQFDAFHLETTADGESQKSGISINPLRTTESSSPLRTTESFKTETKRDSVIYLEPENTDSTRRRLAKHVSADTVMNRLLVQTSK